MRRKRQCLIITATIIPNSNFVSQNNPSDRRMEYLEVLKYYVNCFGGDIYFAENSGYYFDDDQEFNLLFNLDNVFCLAFPKSNKVTEGKGYQEFEVLDGVVSKIQDKYEEIFKVSGRYTVVNFDQLSSQKNNGIIIDRHQVKKVAITSFFRCTTDIYQSLIKGCYQDVNDDQGIFIEHVIYKKLKEIENNQIDLFIKTPLYEGVSGSYGGSLNRHPLKTKLINIERTLLRKKGVKELKKEFK